MLQALARRPAQACRAGCRLLQRSASVASYHTRKLESPRLAQQSGSALRYSGSRLPVLALRQTARFNSSEAPATEAAVEEDEPQGAQPPRFKDLLQMGVHPTIVSTITQRLGFQNMTDVQAKTIRPAMAGKDL